MTMRIVALLTLVAAPTVALAQAMGHDQHHGGGVAAVQPLYERLKDLYVRSAEQMPAEHYGYRPTPEVRTFGEILGHVANENYLFCASAMGAQNPNETDFESVTDKSEMVAAVKASFEYCDPAYQMAEARAMEQVEFFGQQGSRLWVLMFNVVHDSEHYGNIVTYLREKGEVPPSSQGGI